MARQMSIVVFCLVALLVRTSQVRAAVDCGSVLANILPCSNYLGNVFPIAPGGQCCSGANTVVETGDIDSLCQCFRFNPLASNFLISKAQQLPNQCNITSFLPLVNCLIPSSNANVPLPPLIPLTPVVPIPPVFPFPPVVPIPPVFPFPPVVPIPPVFPFPPVVPIPPVFSFPPVVPDPPTVPIPPVVPDPIAPSP